MNRHLLVCFVLLASNNFLSADTFVIDDFDGGQDARRLSRSFTPDTTVTPFESAEDVFGIIDRGQNSDFADNSVSNPAGDRLGVVPETKTDFFFGVEDIKDNTADHPVNPDGGGIGVWTVDISGLSNLSVSVVLSAMGDFESGDNSHTFTAMIDDGPVQTLIEIDADESIRPYTYTMADGVTTNDFDDPLRLTDSLGSRIIDNSFTTTATGIVVGTGDVLTLTYTAGTNNGGDEVFAFDDITLSDEKVVLSVDLDNDLDIDGYDFLEIQRFHPTRISQWKLEFGSTPDAALVTLVPEPTAITLVGVALTYMPLISRARKEGT